MSVELRPEQVSENTPSERTHANRTTLPRRIWSGTIGLWKYFLGVVLCQSALLSVFVVGWCYRLIQRTVFHAWWRTSPTASPDFS